MRPRLHTPQAFDFPDHAAETALIQRTCDAEDEARRVTAPYNKDVTADELARVHAELGAVLEAQLGRGRHQRMDIVISLRTKMDDVNARLRTLVPDVA